MAHTRKSQVNRYFNRELSWLAFNRRVLEQAYSEKYPLLERIRFLSFVSSNLDQFYEIRVAGLMQRVDSGSSKADQDGISPVKLLDEVRDQANSLFKDQYRCWDKDLCPSLAEEGINFKSVEELTAGEFSWLQSYFRREVFPVLTPLAIDPTHPFPLILNKSLNLIVSLSNSRSKRSPKLVAIVPVPRILPRLVRVKSTKPRNEITYLFLCDVVRHFVASLFPGHKVLGAWSFRITRNSDLYIDEEEVENLLSTIEEELHNLRKGAAVRLEIDADAEEDLREYLLSAINLGGKDVCLVDGPINFYRLMSLPGEVDRPDLKFSPYVPRLPSALSDSSKLFKAIRKQDFLLHHPFDSFVPVVDFLRQAAEDPDVFAVKLTLYRTSGDSPIVQALMDAALNGKQVTALVELKARFDEEANINWARRMEEVGVHVVYGLPGLKTHSKCCLVVRREKSGLRRYVHLGTGNYNPVTAKLYTDYSFFTSSPAISRDVANLFNALTGYSRSPKFKKLITAPFELHKRMLELIGSETKAAKAGKPARIILKVNSLLDRKVIDALYKASRSGVRVDLIVRGICGLVPGQKDLSENIRVVSVLGQYLEHSRVYYFENGGDSPILYLGSADWMPRNFFRRVEAIFPIENETMIHDVFSVLEKYLADSAYAKELRSSGDYSIVKRRKGKALYSVQEDLQGIE